MARLGLPPSPWRPASPRRWPALIAAVIVASGIVLAQVPAAHATTDFYWAEQWGPSQIGAPEAWQVTTGSGVRIGVVDTGVDLEHEDLAGKIVASTDCIDTQGSAAACEGTGQDDIGHGTAVSSIAAAITDNGEGIAGVAPGAELVVARSLTGDGDGGALGSTADLMAGIDWVVAHGARIVNLSLGTDADGSGRSPMGPAMERAWARGAIPVVAAGNGTPGEAPSTYAGLNAVVVGATYRDGGAAPYSESLDGTKWGIVAPGGSGGDARPSFIEENIVSATLVPGETDSYAAFSGTSIAAPHVSGGLALLLAQGLSREDAIARMLETADDSWPCGPGCHGRLDVARAVGAMGSAPTPVVEAEDSGSASVEESEADGEVETPTEDAVVAPPEEPEARRPVPLAEPLAAEVPSGVASDRIRVPAPEPGPSLRLTTSSGPHALMPQGLLVLAVSVTVVASLFPKSSARRHRRGGAAG